MSKPEPRVHRVKLATHAVFEIEVFAADMEEAEHIARAKRGESRFMYRTTLEPFRTETWEPKNRHDPESEFHWVECLPWYVRQWLRR